MKVFLVPMLEGLSELLEGPEPQMLDVGVGIAAMAVEYCRQFPNLRVVGLDVFPRALELAETTVRQAGMSDRIELREQDVATLDDQDRFALAWLPAPFIPRDALVTGVSRAAKALVTGGWLVLAHGKFGDDERDNAVSRFKTDVFGGTPLDDPEAESLLASAGLESVFTAPTPPNAPAITVGRRPRSTG